jgi:hypothetical protein
VLLLSAMDRYAEFLHAERVSNPALESEPDAPQNAGRSKVPYPQPTETIPMTVIPDIASGHSQSSL